MVGDTYKVTKIGSRVCFRLTPRSMTLDDLDLLKTRILLEFREISQIWEPITTAKRTKIATECNRLNVLCNIMFLCVDLPYSLLGTFVHALLSRAYLSVS